MRAACIGALLEDSSWQELVVGLTAVGHLWREALAALEPSKAHYIRELDRSVSYQANLSAGFEAYLKELGQSARRSVWNLRSRLASHGRISVQRLDATEIDSGFDDLNRLHQLRWLKPAFTGKRLAFHRELARELIGVGELALSRIVVGRRVVSVLYDIRKGLNQYNIKMAFDPSFSSRLSLGLIHLGYAMEDAASHGVTMYDFLAGPGQKNDYKRHLSQGRRELSSVQMVRGPLLPRLYRWYDRLRLAHD